MKYLWSDKPPKGVPGVAADKSDVWPKPVKESLKYAAVGRFVVAIGQIKTNGRWEVYVFEDVIQYRHLLHKIVKRWQAKSRFVKDHRIGYSNRKNCYRSITKHLESV